MKKLCIAFALMLVALPVGAQQLDLSSLDVLGAGADNIVSVNIGAEMFAFARAFLSEDDAEQAAALAITEDFEGIQVRVYEFDQPGSYDPAALDAVRAQLTSGGWAQMVEVDEGDEHVGVWMMMDPTEPGTMRGTVVLVEEADEVVVVNLMGSITADDLAALGRQFDLEEFADLEGLIGQFAGFDGFDDDDKADED